LSFNQRSRVLNIFPTHDANLLIQPDLGMFFKDQSKKDDQDAYQEHENGNPVDPVHVFYPGAGRFVWISLNDIKIFSNFTQYTHCANKDN
jgi:hypothetical protein